MEYLDKIQRKPPVFITGYMRSGTTLLGNIVDRHPAIAVFIESFFIPRYFFTQPLFWPLGRDQNYLRLARCIVDERRSQRNGVTMGDSGDLLANERTLPALIDALFLQWAMSRGKQRWADKSPGYISKISVLDRMFPDARFVHIVRDGRDVWLSVKKLGWQTDVVKVATDWSKTVSHARRYGASMSPGRYLEVGYERLVAFPEEEARRIAAFLDEPYDRTMVQPDEEGPGNPALDGWPGVDKAIDPENTRKWKKQLSDYELAAFDLCAGELLQSLGYEVPAARHSFSRRMSTKLRQGKNRVERLVGLTGKTARLFALTASRRIAS